MFAPSIPVMAAWANAGILLAAGLVNLAGFPRLHEIYAEYDIPAGFYRTIGIAQVFAALFLATPELRVWGILLAAPIMFVSVVFLLDHRQYRYAAPIVIMMAGLVVATLAVPPFHTYHAAEVPSHFVTNIRTRRIGEEQWRQKHLLLPLPGMLLATITIRSQADQAGDEHG